MRNLDCDGGERIWASRDFKVTVNGDAVPTIHKDVDMVSGPEIAMPKGTRKLHYQGAYIWQVHFKPNERITVRNTYAFGGSTSVYGDQGLDAGNIGSSPQKRRFLGKNQTKALPVGFRQ